MYRTLRSSRTGRCTTAVSCRRRRTGPCYGPDQIRAAYGIQPLLSAGKDGTGRTIAIIDAYGSPTLAADLAYFDARWGLPAANLTTCTPFGAPDPTDPDNAAAGRGDDARRRVGTCVAPGAKILLIIAKSNNDSDILARRSGSPTQHRRRPLPELRRGRVVHGPASPAAAARDLPTGCSRASRSSPRRETTEPPSRAATATRSEGGEHPGERPGRHGRRRHDAHADGLTGAYGSGVGLERRRPARRPAAGGGGVSQCVYPRRSTRRR